MPRQITEKQRLKLLAAAELVQGGDMAVLKKILEFQEFLEDNEEKIKQMIISLVKIQADAEFADTKGSMNKEITKGLDSLNVDLTKLSKVISKDASKEIQTFASSLKKQIEDVKKLIPELPPETDLSDFFKRFNELENMISVVTENIPETFNPMEIDQRIEENRDWAEEEHKKLDDKIKSMVVGRGGGVRRVFQPYRDNFTSQTDGTTKTFYLSREPLKTNTIMAWGTDFPIILDPDTDFTVSGKTFTLTDAVDAPTAGASFIVHFYA